MQYDYESLIEIRDYIDEADLVAMHNGKFDFRMIHFAFRDLGIEWDPPWHKVHETLFTAHMMASCQRKDLTTLMLTDMDLNVKPFEDKVKASTQKARRIMRTKAFQEAHGRWRYSEQGLPEMPSAGKDDWKSDMHMLRSMCRLAPEFLPDWEGWRAPVNKRNEKYPGDPVEEHPWQTDCSTYANSDSAGTLPLCYDHLQRVKEQGLWNIYQERRKLMPIVYQMEEDGLTVSEPARDNLVEEYTNVTQRLRDECIEIADNPDLEDLPVNGSSNALKEVVFGQFKLVAHKKTKGGSPECMDKDVIERWLMDLDPETKPARFLTALKGYRQRKTALGYLKGYTSFWRSIDKDSDYRLLHPSLNPTGTNTLRWSSSHPNEQNISKKQGFNLRSCFGPAPGRLWASLDYENLELRIPAYEANETEMVSLFEKPDEPPFYGSVHMLNFSIVYPDLWAEAIAKARDVDKASRWIKEHWKDSWYQYCKNGDFAVQYGSVLRKPPKWSTADRAFKRLGSHLKLVEKFDKLEKLNRHYIAMANRTGYVTTLADHEVDPLQGYPVQCSRTAYNRISPTVPLNYHVQSTACWVASRAMVKVYDYFQQINAGKPAHLHWKLIMQVHDELVLDFPRRKGYESRLRKVKALMESCGDAICVPLRVGCEIHEDNWSKGFALAM